MDKTTTNSSRSSSNGGGDSPSRELSCRLQTLHAYHSNEQVVWDIGCDHGLLGLSFREVSGVDEIHLVDPSDKVIEVLQTKVKDSYISKPKVFIHHKEGQSTQPAPSSNLIFIAGMGGKEIGEIVTHLCSILDSTSKIVISPHRKILELRELLRALPLTLLKEEVIEEDQQFYQIMSLRPSRDGLKVSLYGEEIWASETGQKYRNHQIKHFSSHKDLASEEYVSYLMALKPSKSTPKENL